MRKITHIIITINCLRSLFLPHVLLSIVLITNILGHNLAPWLILSDQGSALPRWTLPLAPPPVSVSSYRDKAALCYTPCNTLEIRMRKCCVTLKHYISLDVDSTPTDTYLWLWNTNPIKFLRTVPETVDFASCCKRKWWGMFFRLEHTDEIVKSEGKGRMDSESLRKCILENQPSRNGNARQQL